MSKKYSKLKNYISKKMSMSHIYQPLMLIELIKGNGKASGNNIAKSFLSYDETQIDYYKKITTLMPFKYLSKHLNEIKKLKDNYSFEDFDLGESQKDELIKMCIIFITLLRITSVTKCLEVTQFIFTTFGSWYYMVNF